MKEACTGLPRMINYTVVRQTLPPIRVVVGISHPTALDSTAIACLEAARQAASPVPLVWVVNLTKGSASASRNVALSVTDPDEAVAFHDADDFMHPQACTACIPQ